MVVILEKAKETGRGDAMKKRQYMSRRLAACGAVALLTGCLLSTGYAGQKLRCGGDTVSDGAYLLTVDGYGVTEEEYLLFLRDQKAATVNYFWVNYEIQPDEAFWTDEVNGETPIAYAKEKALASVVRAKEEFILASERGILEYKDYGSMMEDMRAENTGRADKKENGGVFYGITEFTPFTYYQYINGNIRSELERSQEELSVPSRKQLQELYEENKENLTRGTVYSYTVFYADGRKEDVNQNTLEIGKEDSTTADLIYNYFAYMSPKDGIEGYPYRGEQADIVLNSVENLGYMSFEEAKDSLGVFFARRELGRLIEERVENAELVFDQARYDALDMP